MAIPKVFLVAVLCCASANGDGDPCAIPSQPAPMGPGPMVPAATITTSPEPGKRPCATAPPGKQIGIDVGIGLGSAAVAGAVGGLVWIAHEELSTSTKPQLFPVQPGLSPEPFPVKLSGDQLSRITYRINNETKTTIDGDVQKLAGGLSIFMVLGGVCLFCLLAALLRAGFKKTRSKIEEEEHADKKGMKKLDKKVDKETEMMANPLIKQEKKKKKEKKDKKEKKSKSGGDSGSDSSSSSSSGSSDSEHSDKRQSGCCV